MKISSDHRIVTGANVTTSDHHFEGFIGVLMEDNVEAFESYLKQFNEEDQLKILNSPTNLDISNKRPFTLNDTMESHIEVACRKFCLCHPWSYAVAFGAKKVMSSMIKHGIDIYIRESNGANCLHILTFLAYVESETEELRVSVFRYLQEILSTEQLKCLLEDDTKVLRPLEFAAHLQTFLLYSAFFETPGVYLICIEHDGIYSREYYDITAYESKCVNNRRSKSPLLLFLLLDRRNMEQKHVRQFFESELMQSWLNSKFKMNHIFVWMWLIVRVTLVFSFIFSDESWSAVKLGQNETHPCPFTMQWYTEPYQTFVACSQLIMAAIVIIFDLAEISLLVYHKVYQYIKTPRGIKQLAVHYIFYRTVQFTMSLCLFLLCVDYLCCRYSDQCAFPPIASHYFYVFVCFSSSWTLLFFLQSVPWFGFVVMALQRMIQDLLAFALIFFSVMSPFAFAFKKFLSTDGTQCYQEFNQFMDVYYYTFKVMLNMVDFDKYALKDRSALHVLHIVYVFIISILMVNFLIALFSTSYAKVYANRNTYLFIQKLSVVSTIETRLIQIIPKFYNWQRNRCFLTTNDGKVLLRRVVLRDKYALIQREATDINDKMTKL